MFDLLAIVFYAHTDAIHPEMPERTQFREGRAREGMGMGSPLAIDDVRPLLMGSGGRMELALDASVFFCSIEFGRCAKRPPSRRSQSPTGAGTGEREGAGA